MPFWKRDPVRDLMEAATKAQLAGDNRKAMTLFQELVDKGRATGDRRAEAVGLQRRGVLKDLRGDAAGAEADVRAALAIDVVLEGNDGETVRQDWYTLGVILAGRGAVAGGDGGVAAEQPFFESARIAGLNDPDAHFRALNNVVMLRMKRDDRAGVLQLVWDFRPSAKGPRWLLGAVHAGTLVRLLADVGRLDDIAPIVDELAITEGYWLAKLKMFGRIGAETMTAISSAVVDAHVVAANAFAHAARKDEAVAFVDRLEKIVRNDPNAVAQVKQMRAAMLADLAT